MSQSRSNKTHFMDIFEPNEKKQKTSHSKPTPTVSTQQEHKSSKLGDQASGCLKTNVQDSSANSKLNLTQLDSIKFELKLTIEKQLKELFCNAFTSLKQEIINDIRKTINDQLTKDLTQNHTILDNIADRLELQQRNNKILTTLEYQIDKCSTNVDNLNRKIAIVFDIENKSEQKMSCENN